MNQSYSTWELILIDDGTPDRSGEICDEYAMKDKRIKVIHQQNAGVAAARNSGIALATGDYAIYLDSDDFLHPDCLKNLVYIAEQQNADIVQCSYVSGNDMVFPSVDHSEVVALYDNHSIFAKDVAKVIVWGKLYRIGLIKDIRIPEGKYFEDEHVTWRWYYAANRIIVTSRPYYYYTCYEQSTMAQHRRKPNLSFIDAYKERVDFFRMTGERDLEDYSHRHICKSLCMSFCNPNLASEQKELIKKMFQNSWNSIRHSSYIGWKYKMLFYVYEYCPNIVRRLLKDSRQKVYLI